jgi:protease I
MYRILIVTGDGGESYEALYAMHRLEEEGWKGVVAAPSRRRLKLVMHDFTPGWDTYIERRGYGVTAELTFDDVRVEDYAGVLILGGRAPEYLRDDDKVIEIVKQFDREGKWVFAICHGVQVLAAAGLIRGKRVTCYTHVRREAEQAGATFVDEQTVRDGRVVTAQTWQSHPSFYREIVARLSGNMRGEIVMTKAQTQE